MDLKDSTGVALAADDLVAVVSLGEKGEGGIVDPAKDSSTWHSPTEEVNLDDPKLAEDKIMRAGAADSNFVADFRALTQAIRFEERKNDSYVNRPGKHYSLQAALLSLKLLSQHIVLLQ